MSFFKRIANAITYDARLDPAVIPGKLDLGPMGIAPYHVVYDRLDGSSETIKANDPDRTVRFEMSDSSAHAAKWRNSVLTRRTAACLGAVFAVLGATMGACLALGAYPAAVSVAALLCAALYTVGTTPVPVQYQPPREPLSYYRSNPEGCR